jgi:zinc/manganese transport system permease protein
MENFWSFFTIQAVLIAVVLSVHTYLGLHIIRRNLIFSDLALDQLAALGVIVGIGMGMEGGTIGSYVVASGAVLVGAVLMAVVKPKKKEIPREAVIGIIYCLALVTSFLAAEHISGGLGYVTQTLSGTILWVNWNLVWVTVVAYVLIAVFHYVFRDKITGITDGRITENVVIWDLLFFLTLGIIAVLIVPVAGVLLAYSFLMIPAAIAALFTRGWVSGLLIGWGVGFIACFIGLMTSYFLRLPYGPSLVLSLGVFFLGALALRLLMSEQLD